MTGSGTKFLQLSLMLCCLMSSVYSYAQEEPAAYLATSLEHHQTRPQSKVDTSVESPKGHRYSSPPPIPVAPNEIAELGLLPTDHDVSFTLSDLEALACQYNPTLLQAHAQVQGALGEAIQAGLWPNPTAVYVGEQIGVDGTPGEYQGGAIRQEIVTGRKLDLSRAKFRARTRVAEWNALAQQYRVLNDVRIHYFRARGLQDVLQVRKELLKNAEDHVATTLEMFNQGQASRAEVHHANIQLQQHRLEVMMTVNDFQQAFNELSAVAGVELEPSRLDTALEGDLTPIDWNDALARLLDESPQILAARSKLQADQITVKREIVEPIPNVVIEAGAGHNFEVGSQTTAMASVAVEVPIFDWNQGTIRQAEADYARQQGEVRRLELELRRELGQRYRDYLTALQHVQNYQESILPESRREYELQLESYKADRLPWMPVLASERDYFMLRADYIQRLVTWRESEVLIIGYLLNGGLTAPPSPVPPGHINAVPKPR